MRECVREREREREREGEMEGAFDATTTSNVKKIPLLKSKAGPRDDAEAWQARLKEELMALIAYIKWNKQNDNDWFTVSPANKEGTKWKGKCWYIHNMLKYDFDLQFEIPATYPQTAIELELPELEGKYETPHSQQPTHTHTHPIPFRQRGSGSVGHCESGARAS